MTPSVHQSYHCFILLNIKEGGCYIKIPVLENVIHN